MPTPTSQIPTWLKELLELEVSERAQLRKMTQEIHKLLIQKDLESLNLLVSFPENRQLYPNTQAAILCLTYTARHKIAAWPKALRETKRSLESHGVCVADYLSPLLFKDEEA